MNLKEWAEREGERMAPVDDAPETKERIRRGEITSARDARGEALKETGKQGDIPAEDLREHLDRLEKLLG